MRVRMKLSSFLDKDLLTLDSIPEFDFRKWIWDTVRAYANSGDIQKIQLPAASPDKPVLKSKMYSITFDKTKDVVVVDFLSEVQDRLRSCVIKSILRCSLSRPCLYTHFKDYPAPFPVVLPEDGKPIEHTEPTAINAAPATMLTAPSSSFSAETSYDAPMDFNVFDFDDRIG